MPDAVFIAPVLVSEFAPFLSGDQDDGRVFAWSQNAALHLHPRLASPHLVELIAAIETPPLEDFGIGHGAEAYDQNPSLLLPAARTSLRSTFTKRVMTPWSRIPSAVSSTIGGHGGAVQVRGR